MSSFFVSSIKEDAMVDLEWTVMQEALDSDVDGNVDPDDGALVACLRRVRQTLIQNQQGIENRSKNLLLNTQKLAYRKCKRPPK
jgi:hypothetical protein